MVTIVVMMILCMARVLYILLSLNGIYHFSILLLLTGLGVLADHHWFVSCRATTIYLC